MLISSIVGQWKTYARTKSHKGQAVGLPFDQESMVWDGAFNPYQKSDGEQWHWLKEQAWT